jgi:hypothetical protein
MLKRLWRSRGGRFFLALAALAGAGLLVGLPLSEEYSDFGYLSTSGLVEVRCGSVVSSEIDVQFRDYQEQLDWNSDYSAEWSWRIFEGKSATEVCDDLRGSRRTAGLGLAGVGGLLVLFALVGSSKRAGAALPSPTRAPEARSEPRSEPTPESTSEPLSEPTSVAAEGRWAADPFGRHELRYWDGALWTEHVSDLGVVSVDAPTHRLDAPTPSGTISTELPPPVPVFDVPVLPVLVPEEVAPTPPAPAPPRVVFSDGTEMVVDSSILVGRDPTADAGTRVHRVDDLLVSKTHLAISVDDQGTVWVEDRHSTNGSSLQYADGSVESLVAAQPTIMNDGLVVRFGDRTVRLVPEASRKSNA